MRKEKHKNLSLEDIERIEMDADPLQKLDRKRTSRLDNFFSLSAEEDDAVYSQRRNPEYKAVERFLSHAHKSHA